MSGLSLRTVQRLEAGHRVSYASLRALAVAFRVDVDQLERELYAVSQPSDDFLEIPRWLRVLNDTFRFGGMRVGRRDLQVLEGVLVGVAVVLLVASFVVASDKAATVLRLGAFVELLCGYWVTVAVRINDRYKLWQAPEGAQPPPLPRTWRRTAAEYAFHFGLGILSIALLLWLL
jgi:hypothetical protein